jgi:hypothetical protein
LILINKSLWPLSARRHPLARSHAPNNCLWAARGVRALSRTPLSLSAARAIYRQSRPRPYLLPDSQYFIPFYYYTLGALRPYLYTEKKHTNVPSVVSSCECAYGNGVPPNCGLLIFFTRYTFPGSRILFPWVCYEIMHSWSRLYAGHPVMNGTRKIAGLFQVKSKPKHFGFWLCYRCKCVNGIYSKNFFSWLATGSVNSFKFVPLYERAQSIRYLWDSLVTSV